MGRCERCGVKMRLVYKEIPVCSTCYLREVARLSSQTDGAGSSPNEYSRVRHSPRTTPTSPDPSV